MEKIKKIGIYLVFVFLMFQAIAQAGDPPECEEKLKGFTDKVREETNCFRDLDNCKVKPSHAPDCLALGQKCLALQAENDKLRKECQEKTWQIGADVEKEFKGKPH